MHSEAYDRFIKHIGSTGSNKMQGYNPNLLKLINPEEMSEVENKIIELFKKGDLQTAMFMPKLTSVNGVDMLKDKIKFYKKPSYAFCEFAYILYNATNDEQYLDGLISILDNDNYNETVRADAVTALLRCGKNEKIYSAYKKGCLNDDDEDIRFRCSVGMFYCKGVIKNPLGVHPLDDKWRKIKLKLFTGDKESRREAIDNFESMF